MFNTVPNIYYSVKCCVLINRSVDLTINRISEIVIGDSINTSWPLTVGDAGSLRSSPYNSNLPTVLVIHGWLSSYLGDFSQAIKDAYLLRDNYNVILADYHQFAIEYLTLVLNAPNIGAAIACLPNYLIETGSLNLKDLHIIGHSIGAHIAGFTSKNIPGRVPRITGLDPAGPGYDLTIPEARLNKDDAICVDIIATSVTLGLGQSIGTINFFPNGGKNQPTCEGMENVLGSCDHSSSWNYYQYSILNKTAFPAKRCQNTYDAKHAPEKCTDDPGVYMGEAANDPCKKGIYYVDVQSFHSS